jgi:carboxyl-terminal processing protease
LRTGFVITEIDGKPVTESAKKFSASTERPLMVKLRLERTLAAQIGGTPKTTLKLRYLDENNQPQAGSIVREPVGGEVSPAFGNFPPQHTVFEARRLRGNVGYIRFNIFVMSLMDRLRAAIRQMGDAPGLIIDLRGNPGGVGGMANGIAGMLEQHDGSLGVMKTRGGELKFAFFSQPGAYAGKVIILMDSGSASTSEVFAAGMQELGRVRVVGEQSIGAALPSVFEKLPTGAIFQYAIADFRTPKGILIEGRGVIPDTEVKVTRRSLLQGRDEPLETAVQTILGN